MKNKRTSCLSGCLLGLFSLWAITGIIALILVENISITPFAISIKIKDLSISTENEQTVQSATLALTPITENISPSLTAIELGEETNTLQIIKNTVVPATDYKDIARRFKGIDLTGFPKTVSSPILEVGDEKTFYCCEDENNQGRSVIATLRYQTPHLYFWVENGIYVSSRDLELLGENFENSI